MLILVHSSAKIFCNFLRNGFTLLPLCIFDTLPTGAIVGVISQIAPGVFHEAVNHITKTSLITCSLRDSVVASGTYRLESKATQMKHR